jgi:hypothetical protein
METPPAPSSIGPANLTGLSQDVLEIKNTIMDFRAAVEEGDAILRELTGLVVITQEEAEMLINVSDLVEEYCGEVEVEVEIREMVEWYFELGFGNGMVGEEEEVKKPRHERKDSGIGLDDEGILSEKSEGGIEFLDDRSLEEMKPVHHQDEIGANHE